MSGNADQTKPLSYVFTRSTELSGYASTHVRTSALAGIAIVWLFAGDASGLSRLAAAPPLLVAAGGAFASSLGADILHYYASAWRWRKLAKEYENKGEFGDNPVKVPVSVPRVGYIFYNAKVVLLLLGYVLVTIEFVLALT